MSTNDTSPAAQLSYLTTLAHDSGRDVPQDVTKAQASRLIDELRQASPRVDDGGSSGA